MNPSMFESFHPVLFRKWQQLFSFPHSGNKHYTSTDSTVSFFLSFWFNAALKKKKSKKHANICWSKVVPNCETSIARPLPSISASFSSFFKSKNRKLQPTCSEWSGNVTKYSVYFYFRLQICRILNPFKSPGILPRRQFIETESRNLGRRFRRL